VNVMFGDWRAVWRKSVSKLNLCFLKKEVVFGEQN